MEHIESLESIELIDERFDVYSVNNQEADKVEDKKQTQENDLVFQEKSCDSVPSLYLQLQLKGKGRQAKEHLTVNKKIFGDERG